MIPRMEVRYVATGLGRESGQGLPSMGREAQTGAPWKRDETYGLLRSRAGEMLCGVTTTVLFAHEGRACRNPRHKASSRMTLPKGASAFWPCWAGRA